MSRKTWLEQLNTKTTDEQNFQTAYRIMATKWGLNPNPDDPKHFYDYRALYRDTGKLEPDSTGHFPSKYKKEGHPDLVINGMDTRTGKKYVPPNERNIAPEPIEPTLKTSSLEVQGRTRGIGTTVPEIKSPIEIASRTGGIQPEIKPGILNRTRGISAADIEKFKPQPKPKPEPIYKAVPEGWYKEGKIIDAVQTFNQGLLYVGYQTCQFFHDFLPKYMNQPVTEDVEVGGRLGIKRTLPMDEVNERKRENILAGQEAYDRTKKGYEALLARHPEWVPRVEYQGSFIENIKKNPLLLFDYGYISQIMAESLAFSLGTMTITAAATAASGGNPFVGGLAMFMVMYPQEAQQMFETLQEHDFTEEEALKTATWSAAIITAIEASEDIYLLGKLVPGLKKPLVGTATKTITKTLVKPTMRSYLKVAGTDALKTISGETLEEIAQAFTEDETIRIVDKTHEILPDLAEISARTFVSSLGFGAVSGYQGAMQQYRTNMLNMAIEADKVKNNNPDIKKSVSEVLQKVKKTEETQTTPRTEIKTGHVYLADVFRGMKEGAPTDEGLFGKGTYYTTNEEYAAGYGEVHKAKVKLYNPFVINNQAEAQAFWDKFTKPERKKAIDAGKTSKEANEIASMKAHKKLVDLGYDGVIARNIQEKGDEVVVFDVSKAMKVMPIPVELDTSGTIEQVEQAEITYAGTEEVGDVGTPQIGIEYESLFTEEEQALYSENKPVEKIKEEEDRLRETLKTETKSLNDFKKKKKGLERLYKKAIRALRDELNAQSEIITEGDEIQAYAYGRIKMRTPVQTKTEWQDTLGPGHYARIFSDNPNLSSPDVVANSLRKPITEDQLREQIAEAIRNRPKKVTFEEAEERIVDPEITNIKVKIETMEDVISSLEETMIAGEEKIKPTQEQQTKLDSLLEEDPRFRKAAENLYDKRVDQLTKTEVETVIMQLERAKTILEKTKGFRRPTFIAKLFTPHIVYSEVLGVKPIVEKAEKGKQEQDIEYRNVSNIAGKVISSLNKGVTTIGQRLEAFKRNKPTPIEAKMAELLNTYKEAPKNLSEQETKVFKYLDELRRVLLKRQNQVRAEIGLPLIKGKQAYFKHIIDVMAEAAMLKYGLLDTETTNPVDFRDFPFPEEIIRFIEKTVASGIYNPAAIRRKLGDELTALWNKDLRVVTNAMLWTALKEIHLAKPLKGLVESLDALDTVPGTIPSTTKKWLVDYVNQCIKGQENETDVAVNDILNQSGLKGFLDKLLVPYGRRLGPKPLTKLLAGTGKLIIYAVMGPIPRQILRNTFQTVQNIALYGVKATVKGMFSTPEQCKKIMKKSIYFRSYTGLEEVPEGILSKFGEWYLKGYQMSAIWNAGNSMKAAYHFNMEKITGKYQHTKYSWADPERTANTPEGYLFESEEEKLSKEMEWGARSCQYQYTPLGMPGIFRYKSAVPFTRLQSWWMNYFFNFTREAATRMFKGENGYGVKLPASERLNYAKYLLIGGIVLNGLGYKKSFMFGVLPMYWSPAAAAAMAMYQYTFAQSDYDREKALERLKRSYQALIPGYLGVKTWNDVLNGNMSMDELFFYGKTDKKKPSYKGGSYQAKKKYGKSRYVPRANR